MKKGIERVEGIEGKERIKELRVSGYELRVKSVSL